MTDDKTIGVGDICTYSYDNDNKSLSIVEVVEEFSDEVLVVKFLQVIVDNSGNGLFTYLCKTGKTMNVSKKYLHKILLINRQKAEIERLKFITTSNPYCVSIGTADIFTENHEEYEWLLARISAEAIKEFAERLKSEKTTAISCDLFEEVVRKSDIDNLVKEMAGEG